MNYSSFFIPYLSPTHTKEDIIDIISNTYHIGEVDTIDIVFSKKGNHMAFIHMKTMIISDNTNKIFSIIREQGQYYLYDIMKRMKLVLKFMIPKQYQEKHIKIDIDKKLEILSTELSMKMNKKIIGIYNELENIKHNLYELQRKIYGYSIQSHHIGNNDNSLSWT